MRDAGVCKLLAMGSIHFLTRLEITANLPQGTCFNYKLFLSLALLSFLLHSLKLKAFPNASCLKYEFSFFPVLKGLDLAGSEQWTPPARCWALLTWADVNQVPCRSRTKAHSFLPLWNIDKLPRRISLTHNLTVDNWLLARFSLDPEMIDSPHLSCYEMHAAALADFESWDQVL